MTVAPATHGTGWRKLRLRAGPNAAQLDVLVRHAPGGATEVTPARPALASQPGSGRPALALTLLLDRAPTLADASIDDLIAGGRLTLTATLALPEDAGERLRAAGVAAWRPAFARSAAFSLHGLGLTASCDATPGIPRAALGSALGREAAVAALAALDGTPGELRLHAGQRLSDGAPVEHDIALHVLLPAAVAGQPSDAFVSLVTLDGLPVPRRTTVTAARSREVSRATMSMAMRPGRLESVALALTPDRAQPAPAAALASSTLVRPMIATAAMKLHAASDVIIPVGRRLPVIRIPDLPIVEDPGAATFAGRSGGRWYAPVPRIVAPAPADDPATSAFCFELEQSGMVAGPDGPRPGLTATVRVTVDLAAPDGADGAQPVAFGTPSVTLDIPFRAAGDPRVQRQRFSGTAEQRDGHWVATFQLLDDWVRLAYGALAMAGFQAEPARLLVSYAFRAYVRAPEGVSVDVGGKLQLVASAANGIAVDRLRPAFDAARGEVLAGGETLRFQAEVGSRALTAPTLVQARPLAASRAATFGTQTLMVPANHFAVRPPLVAPSLARRALPDSIGAEGPPIIARRPPIIDDGPPIIGDGPPERPMAIQTLVREEHVDLLFACSELGGLYRQRSQDGERAIGCQDTLRLGDIHYALYEELPQLADEHCRVLRSLRQPGHFLLLPATYRVTRYEATEPPDRAYRPAVLLYAAIAEDPTKTRVYLSATLEPDLPPWVRAKITARLVPLCPAGQTPVLELPTDAAVAAQKAFTWALPDAFGTPEAQVIDRMLQVGVSTTLQQATLLRALIEGDGAHGAIHFTLPDGMTLDSAIVIDTNPTGPWIAGIVSAQPVDGGVELVNHAEQPVSVLDLLGADAGSVAVNRTLAPAERATVAADGLTGAPIPATAPASGGVSLAQLNVFVEEITTNVIFVNLVNYANHGLTKLVVTARLQGTQQLWAAELTEQASATVEMQLGLMTYLEHQVLEYQVAKQAGDAVTTTPWLTWDLERGGNVVSITWESISGSLS